MHVNILSDIFCHSAHPDIAIFQFCILLFFLHIHRLFPDIFLRSICLFLKQPYCFLKHRHVLGQAIRIRSPYVDALSVTQVLALGSLRKRVDKEELTHGQKENYTYLILCTVSGVAAGLQNTG